MASTEPTDLNHPHPGHRIDIQDLSPRKISNTGNTSVFPPKRPSNASSIETASSQEGISRNETPEATHQGQHGIAVRDFATVKAARKPKADVEQSCQLLEKSSLV